MNVERGRDTQKEDSLVVQHICDAHHVLLTAGLTALEER